MTAMPCLQPDELLAFKIAEARSAHRGVDCGPNTAVALLGTIRRLARALTAVQGLAAHAAQAGEHLDPHAVLDAAGSGSGSGEQAQPEQWEWGVRWSSGGCSAMANREGAERVLSAAGGKEWHPHAVAVVRRPVPEWEAAPRG